MASLSIESPASQLRIAQLWDDLAALERSSLPDGANSRDAFVAWHLAIPNASYAAIFDGRLGGIAFVFDTPSARAMCFTKTQFLCDSLKITFARSIPALFQRLHELESARGANGDLIIHRPCADRDARWFVRAGCTPCGDWLIAPPPNRKDSLT